MDLLRINQTTRQPNALIDNWASLIWTERYSDAGDFTISTGDVEYFENNLPPNTWVSLRDTREIMVVENHTLGYNQLGVRTLTITGRSLSAVLMDSRAAVVNEDPVTPDYSTYSAAKYIQDIINRRLANYHLGSVNYDAEIVAERVAGLGCFDNVTGSVTSVPTDPFPEMFPSGNISSLIYPVLQKYHLGLSISRPTPDSSLIKMNVYVGKDRTPDAGTNLIPGMIYGAPVTFNFDVGDITEYSYLNSTKDERNIAYVNSPLGFAMVLPSGVNVEPTGLDRRVLQVDASDLTDPGSLTDAAAIAVRGRSELAKHNRQSIVDGTISPKSSYAYRGKNATYSYDLGDVISLKGRVNITSDRRITEYIRSQDKNGEKGYPTMAELTENA